MAQRLALFYEFTDVYYFVNEQPRIYRCQWRDTITHNRPNPSLRSEVVVHNYESVDLDLRSTMSFKKRAHSVPMKPPKDWVWDRLHQRLASLAA